MKAFLALNFLTALSLAVSSFWLIRFSFKYHRGLQQYFFQSFIQNRHCVRIENIIAKTLRAGDADLRF